MLNKFSTEKFSIILIIIGFVGIFATAWPTIKNHFDLNEFLFLWIVATFVLLLIWAYSIYKSLQTSLKSEKPASLSREVVTRKGKELISIANNIGLTNVLKNLKEPNEDFTKYLAKIVHFFMFTADFVAKNTEMRMRPIVIFFISLLAITWIQSERYFMVDIQGIMQPVPFLGIPLLWAMAIYAIIFCITGLKWNWTLYGLNIWDEILIYGLTLLAVVSQGRSNAKSAKKVYGDFLYKLKIFGSNLVFLCLGLLLILLWFIVLVAVFNFIVVFPIYLPIALIGNYGFVEFMQIGGRFLIVLVSSWFLFQILEILFSIHLIERIKNDRIAWLKKLKIYLRSISLNDKALMENAWLRFELSEIYLPMPFTSLLAFTRYEIIPVYPNCDDIELDKERLEFMNSH